MHQEDCLQATYVPDYHMFALWNSARDALSTDGEPPSAASGSQTLRLTRPHPRHQGLDVVDTPCHLVPDDELSDIHRVSADSAQSAPSRSLAAWQHIVDGGDAQLPLAGHCVPNASGNAIVSQRHAVSVFQRTHAVTDQLLAAGLSTPLRPYQLRGISWLGETCRAHGGAVLADDMGLGKTVQAIGHLLLTDAPGPHLVVCPTSLVSNWHHELARFAPAVDARMYRGGPLPSASVIICGYPTLRIHIAELSKNSWGTTVFDEAHVLKNPQTQVAKAARRLAAAERVALTGTPVENHLDELWAVLHLVAPSEFAHRAQFRRRFSRPIDDGSKAAVTRLRTAIAPFLLARNKSQVAQSLPPKIHIDLTCDLTEEQQRLYDSTLTAAINAGFGDGLRRHGRVLAAITRLKQICDHPVLVSDEVDEGAELAERSGKLDLCTSIVGEALERGSATIIFTQYRSAGHLLVRHLHSVYGVQADFLHGGLDHQERDRIVTNFQHDDGPPLLILSLRAAGTGLTLTRADNVIHFDRWWNPAVEAQASDRAHRIGQTQTVTVHTLTSATTIEEHIAAMHRRKQAVTSAADTAATDADIAALVALDDDRLIATLSRNLTRERL